MRVRSWHFLVSGGLGGLVGFFLMESLLSAPAQGGQRLELIWSAALYFAGFGLAVGAALGMTEGLVRREGLRVAYGAVAGLLLGAVGGLVGGAVGQGIYGLVPARAQVESTSDLALVLDSSGSMRTTPFTGNDPRGKRKKAALALIDRLTPGDRVAVIDFDDAAKVWMPLTLLSDDAAREVARRAVDRIDSTGGTNLSAGLDAAIAELATHRTTGRSQFIIFLTDGAGDYDPASAERARGSGITVYTIGLGDEVQADLLQQIASHTGGKYFPVADAGDLTQLFGQILTEHRTITGSAAARQGNSVPDNRSPWLPYVLRTIGWAVMGLVVGIGQGIRENTREDLIACSLGGLVGGLIGGALFDPVAAMFAGGGGSASRAIADVVVGAAIGGSMRLIQQKVVDESGKAPTPLSGALMTNSRLRLGDNAAPGAAKGGYTPPPSIAAKPRAAKAEPAAIVEPKLPPRPAAPTSAQMPAETHAGEALAARPSLAWFAEQFSDREEAMARARREGGYSFSEIATHFGVPTSTVRRALDR